MNTHLIFLECVNLATDIWSEATSAAMKTAREM